MTHFKGFAMQQLDCLLLILFTNYLHENSEQCKRPKTLIFVTLMMFPLIYPHFNQAVFSEKKYVELADVLYSFSLNTAEV